MGSVMWPAGRLRYVAVLIGRTTCLASGF